MGCREFLEEKYGLEWSLVCGPSNISNCILLIYYVLFIYCTALSGSLMCVSFANSDPSIFPQTSSPYLYESRRRRPIRSSAQGLGLQLGHSTLPYTQRFQLGCDAVIRRWQEAAGKRQGWSYCSLSTAMGPLWLYGIGHTQHIDHRP